MKALILGGCGIQGRAALFDLSRNPSVDQVTCADIHSDPIFNFEHEREGNTEEVEFQFK